MTAAVTAAVLATLAALPVYEWERHRFPAVGCDEVNLVRRAVRRYEEDLAREAALHPHRAPLLDRAAAEANRRLAVCEHLYYVTVYAEGHPAVLDRELRELRRAAGPLAYYAGRRLTGPTP